MLDVPACRPLNRMASTADNGDSPSEAELSVCGGRGCAFCASSSRGATCRIGDKPWGAGICCAVPGCMAVLDCCPVLRADDQPIIIQATTALRRHTTKTLRVPPELRPK